MDSSEKILVQMEKVLDQLIQIAETMQDLSSQVVSEAELVPLQRSQEKLVSQLAQLDEAYQKSKPPHSTALRAKIQKKLSRFQALNATFINNLKGSQKLIEVEAPATKKGKMRP